MLSPRSENDRDYEILQTNLLDVPSGEKTTWRLTSSPDVNFQYVVFLSLYFISEENLHEFRFKYFIFSNFSWLLFSFFFTTGLLLFRMFHLSNKIYQSFFYLYTTITFSLTHLIFFIYLDLSFDNNETISSSCRLTLSLASGLKSLASFSVFIRTSKSRKVTDDALNVHAVWRLRVFLECS